MLVAGQRTTNSCCISQDMNAKHIVACLCAVKLPLYGFRLRIAFTVCLGGGVWNGFSWLRIGTDRRLVWIQWKTFGFWRYGVSLPFVLGDSQSVYSVWLHIWRPGFDPRQRQRIFLLVCVQTSSEVHSASYPMGTDGPFLGSKAQLRRGVDHWHSSSAEVKYE
jgi:hypothetical protein